MMIKKRSEAIFVIFPQKYFFQRFFLRDFIKIPQADRNPASRPPDRKINEKSSFYQVISLHTAPLDFILYQEAIPMSSIDSERLRAIWKV